MLRRVPMASRKEPLPRHAAPIAAARCDVHTWVHVGQFSPPQQSAYVGLPEPALEQLRPRDDTALKLRGPLPTLVIMHGATVVGCMACHKAGPARCG